MVYRSAGLVFFVLLALLRVLGPLQTAHSQTNSAWRWGVWETNDRGPNGQMKKAPQAAADEINGRGPALRLAKCEGGWLTFLYTPEKSFLDEIPQAPIPPVFKNIVVRWGTANETTLLRLDGWDFDVDVMSRSQAPMEGRFRSLLRAVSFALCPSKEADWARCRQFSGANLSEAVSFVCKRK